MLVVCCKLLNMLIKIVSHVWDALDMFDFMFNRIIVTVSRPTPMLGPLTLFFVLEVVCLGQAKHANDVAK